MMVVRLIKEKFDLNIRFDFVRFKLHIFIHVSVGKNVLCITLVESD